MAGAEEVDRLGRGHRQRNAAPWTLLTFVQPTFPLDAYDSSSIEELLTEAGCSWHLVQFAEAHEGCSAVFCACVSSDEVVVRETLQSAVPDAPRALMRSWGMHQLLEESSRRTEEEAFL